MRRAAPRAGGPTVGSTGDPRRVTMPTGMQVDEDLEIDAPPSTPRVLPAAPPLRDTQTKGPRPMRGWSGVARSARTVPSSEEALITFVNGRFPEQALERFPIDVLPAEVLADWAALSSDLPGEGERVTGTFETDIGRAQYRVRRVLLGDDTGAFVVAILPAAELEEIRDLQTYGVGATLIVLLIASAVAYLVAGRALAPVRELTETAHSISQSDLTRRINVYGAGDAAEMARSFNSMLDRLQAVFRSHKAFVQDASHELRDPLTICRGHLELLSD